MLKTISAFANYHDGFVIIGVSDQGQILGLDHPNEVRLNIENAINDTVKPRPYYEVESKVVNNLTLLLFTIYKGQHTPYTVDRKAYRRADTSSVEVEKHEYDELVLLGRNQSYEELPYVGETLEFNLLATWFAKQLNISAINEDILKSIELIKNGTFNNAAALMADNNRFNEVGIDLIRYADDSLTIIKDRVSLFGVSLLEYFEKSMLFYEKHINHGEIIEKANRVSFEEVPYVAYREAVANALVHRDYSRRGHNRIEFFEDRIEIMSIGGLPIGISQEEFLRGSFSNARNRILADIFYRCGYIEKMGTGIRRIKEAYALESVKPGFELMQNSILIVLPKIKGLSTVSERNPINAFLSPEEEKSYNFIKSTQGVNRQALEEYMGIKRTKAGQILKRLVDQNFIVARGSGRSVTYKVKGTT